MLKSPNLQPADVESLVAQIEELRALSIAAAAASSSNGAARSQSIDPATIRKHPSMESVHSYASVRANGSPASINVKMGDKSTSVDRHGSKKGWVS